VWGAEVGEVGGALGIEVPTPAAAALRLASKSGNFFFLSLLKPISIRKQQVNMGNIGKVNKIQANVRQE